MQSTLPTSGATRAFRSVGTLRMRTPWPTPPPAAHVKAPPVHRSHPAERPPMESRCRSSVWIIFAFERMQEPLMSEHQEASALDKSALDIPVPPLLFIIVYGYVDYEGRLADSSEVIDRLARVNEEQAVKVLDLNREISSGHAWFGRRRASARLPGRTASHPSRH